jgi:hypothetical protein
MAGGGVGEAMLIGAAVGGASSAVKGGNVLEGALLGGAMGGVGSGLSGALSSASTEAAAQAANAGATTAGTTAGATTAGFGGVSGNVPVPGEVGFGSVPSGMRIGGGDLSGLGTGAGAGSEYALGPSPSGINYALTPEAAASNNLALSGTPASITQSPAAAAQPSMMDKAMNWASKNPMATATGAVGLASLLGGAKGTSLDAEKDKYKSKADLSHFRPSWPGYADGGVASLNQGNSLTVGGGINYNNFAAGGVSSLGGYSDGGRMLKGPGDGMSDSIPASISGKQPARLADGEFVVPADVVSHLGNGSTDAGAKQLYSMMDKVRRARTGNKRQGRQIKPGKFVPA